MDSVLACPVEPRRFEGIGPPCSASRRAMTPSRRGSRRPTPGSASGGPSPSSRRRPGGSPWSSSRRADQQSWGGCSEASALSCARHLKMPSPFRHVAGGRCGGVGGFDTGHESASVPWPLFSAGKPSALVLCGGSTRCIVPCPPYAADCPQAAHLPDLEELGALRPPGDRWGGGSPTV